MTSVKINGLEEITAKLKKLEDMKAIVPALRAGALHVKGKIATYPPSSEANTPNQRRWYERGYGSKWMRADGSIGGRKTSEMLGRKWTIGERNAGLTQVVGNNASYGPFVQDAESQAAFHGRRGWKTVQDVAASEADTVIEFIKKEVDKVLES